MFRYCIAILLFAAFNLALTRPARAEPLMLRLPFLPSIVTPLPPSVFTAAALSTHAVPWMPAEFTPLDHSFLGRIARMLNDMKPPMAGWPRESAWRNPSLRDPARERDATSFGIRSAPMSTGGMAFVGAGVGSAAAQLIDFAKTSSKIPVRFGPTMCQGGGGISLKARW